MNINEKFYSMKYVFCAQSNECLDIVAEPANKAAFIENAYDLFNIYKRHHSEFSSLKVLKKNINTAFYGITFPRSSPFYEDMDENVGLMNSNGLTVLWESKNVFTKRFQRLESNPKVLTMEHLEIGFTIHFVCLGTGFIIFIFEVMAAFCKETIQAVVVLSVIRAYSNFKYVTLRLKADSRILDDTSLSSVSTDNENDNEIEI